MGTFAISHTSGIHLTFAIRHTSDIHLTSAIRHTSGIRTATLHVAGVLTPTR